MTRRALPPYPQGSRDWREWGLRLLEFLQDRDSSEAEQLPETVQLLHQTAQRLERATPDGMLMWDPVRQQVVYSDDGIWKTFGSTGSLSYLVTDDAGDGSLTDDINNTDFTGQQGAIGTCAQCPVGTDVSFFHKNIQYIYAGPTPASYGLGCADTMLPEYLIPSGIGSFTALNDTPNSYAGAASKWPRVNPGETALIFDDVEWSDILGKPATYPPSPHTHIEENITDLNRVRWVNPYTPGSSRERNDMVRDGVWTMIANKPTTERPVTEATDSLWIGDGATLVPRGTENEATYWTGQKYTWPSGGYFEGYRIDPPVRSSLFEYSVIARVTLPDGTVGAADQLLAWQTFDGNPGDWITVPSPSVLWLPGTTVEVFLGVRAITQSNTFTANWAVKNQNGNPGAGEAWFQNNQTEIRVNDEDALGADQGDNLTAVQAGGTLQFAGSEWTITSVTDNGAFVTYGVTPVQGRPTEDERSLTFTWGSTDPLPVNSDATFWNGDANIRGIEGIDINNPTENDSQFPIDVLLRDVTISPDWDLVAYSGAGGGGGGGGGEPGVTEWVGLLDTPDSYVGQAGKGVVVKQDELGLEFADASGGASVTSGDAFPDSPSEGDLHYMTQEPVGLYVRYKDPSGDEFWVQTNGGGLGTEAVTIAEDDPSVGYQVIGDILIQFFRVFVSGNQTVNFPLAFKAGIIPEVVGTSELAAGAGASTATIWDINNTSCVCNVRRVDVNGSSSANVSFIAIGEAPDDMKKDKTVGVVGGSGVQEFHDPNGEMSWRIIGNTLELFGTQLTDGAAQITLTFPKTFARTPTITANTRIPPNPSRPELAVSIRNWDETGCQFVARRMNSSSGGDGLTNQPVGFHIIGEWDGVS